MDCFNRRMSLVLTVMLLVLALVTATGKSRRSCTDRAR